MHAPAVSEMRSHSTTAARECESEHDFRVISLADMSRKLATAFAVVSSVAFAAVSCSSSDQGGSSGGSSGAGGAVGSSGSGGASAGATHTAGATSTAGSGGAHAGSGGAASGGTPSSSEAGAAGDSAQGGEAGAPVVAKARPGFRGPLNTGPDPFAAYYNGNYYLTSTQGDSLRLWKSPTLGGLLTVSAVTVWKDTDTTRNQQVWAPSFYLFDGHWYIYYTADDGTDDHHRLYVVESDGTDPLGPYHYKAKLVPPGADSWAIDPVILEQGGKKYMVYSGAGTEGHNLIYIAPMSDAWTISGARTYLTAAGGCPEVREAPAILQHAGSSFIVYSTCDTGKPDYQLWILRLTANADPLVAKSWVQVQGPGFASKDSNGVWGPGSNGFFKSPDGTEDWLIYHGKNTATYTYSGRSTRAGKITWKADGTPDLGIPANASDTLTLPSGDPGDSPFFLDDSGTVQAGGDATISFDKSWQAYGTCGTQCSLGNDHGATATDATATIAFTGTRIALLSARDAGNGIAGYTFDGGKETTTDLYAEVRQGFQLNYLSPRVTYGKHVLKVRVTGQKNANSTGTAVSLDRAEIDTR